MTFEKLLSKKFLVPLLFVSFVYGLVLPFMWGNDPMSELGTLSLLCENRKAWFWLWAILTSGSILLNTQYMYKKYNYKSKFLNTLCVLAFISVCGIALTLGHSIEDWNTKRILHWVSTGLFIAFLIASIALFFIFNIKKQKHFTLLTVCTFAILATFGVIFGTVGKCALMEMIPVAMIQIMLYVVNFTPLLKANK